MPISEQLSRRFVELEAQSNSIAVKDYDGRRSVDGQQWRAWGTSAMHLLRSTFGEDSPHYKNFVHAYEECKGWEDDLKAMKGIFLGAKFDFDGGYLFHIEAAISGEIFGDFVIAAKGALREGQKDVAAVLAAAALEDALKRFARLHALNVNDKSMQDVVNALKAKGLVSGAQKSLLDAMPKIRDLAMHAKWDKIGIDDVSGIVGFVESFLLSKF